MYPVQPILRRSFISSGALTTFAIPSGPVKVECFNLSNIATTAAQVAALSPITAILQSSFAVSGMSAGSGYVYGTLASGAPPAVVQETLIGVNGYTFVDTSIQTPGPLLATTSTTAANPASVATAFTAGLVAGSVVRMINVTNMQQISSMEFTVGAVVPGVSFTLAFMNTTGFVPGAAGFFRVIPNDPIYYPRRRFVTRMSQGLNMIVTLSVTHGYTVGQLVRLVVPTEFGMVQANGLQGTVIAIGQADASGYTNTITLNIDSSAFSAFAFPLSAVAGAGVSFPEVTPIGEAATAPFQNLLDDATRNTAIQGVSLGTGVVGALGNNMLLVAYSALSF